MKTHCVLSGRAAPVLMLSIECVAVAYADGDAPLRSCSSDVAVRVVQQQVYVPVHAYESALNKGARQP